MRGWMRKSQNPPIGVSLSRVANEWGEQQTGRLHDELSSGKVLQTVSSGE